MLSKIAIATTGVIGAAGVKPTNPGQSGLTILKKMQQSRKQAEAEAAMAAVKMEKDPPNTDFLDAATDKVDKSAFVQACDADLQCPPNTPENGSCNYPEGATACQEGCCVFTGAPQAAPPSAQGPPGPQGPPPQQPMPPMPQPPPQAASSSV